VTVLKQAIKDICFTALVRTGAIASRRPAGDGGRLVILMYHKVNPKSDLLGLSISPSFFDYQLAFLKSRYRVISLADALTMISDGIPMGDHAVITFDDGYRDNYDHAFPLLRKHGLPATVFVTVDALETGIFGWNTFDKAIQDGRLDRIDLTQFDLGVIRIATAGEKKRAIVHLHRELKQCDHGTRKAVVTYVVNMLAHGSSPERVMLSWDEAREMQKSGLVVIGSHTVTHPILTRVDRGTARDEIIRSKAVIEERLGTVVDLFAYPNGRTVDFDDDIISMLAQAGYRAACTTVHGSVGAGDDLFRLLRVDVTYGMCRGIGGRFSPGMFEAAMSSGFRKRQ